MTKLPILLTTAFLLLTTIAPAVTDTSFVLEISRTIAMGADDAEEYSPPMTLLQNVFINEIMPANSQLPDEYGEADDWLEIYNGNDTPLSLGSLYLTDDPEDLKKWQIESSPLLPANGFSIFWADGQPEQGEQHAPFKLKSGGEFLALVQELDDSLHILDSLTFPAVVEDISYGRVTDGSEEWVFFGEPSPLATNNEQLLYFNETVHFSATGGHYSDSVTVAMSVADSAANIYYTLDGAPPTPEDLLYENPLTLNSTQLVKARAFKPNYVSRAVATEFYLINEATELAILNVQSNPANFWDDEIGIYVRGTNGYVSYCDNVRNNWNQSWERPCHLTFYEPDGTQGFSVNAGMKIGGACSRNLKMKGLNFLLRSNTYGDEKIDYPIFSTTDVTEFWRVKARNGGTDWIEMLFRDGMNQLVLANTVDLDLIAYRPIRLYLNGNYWGVHGLRETFSKHYVESHHGVDADNLDILADPYGPGRHVREGDFDRYDEMKRFLDDNNLFSTNNYATIQEYIDVEEYLNYHIVQIYLANYDQPGNNVRIWRDRNGGKFRWMLFDTDASTGFQSWNAPACKYNHNTLAHLLNDQPIGGVPGFNQWPNGPRSTFLFRKMMENEGFKNELIQRTCTFQELIFSPERVIPMVDSLENLLQPEVERHIDKWLDHSDLGSGVSAGGSVVQWQENVGHYRTFFNNRNFFIPTFYKNTLDLDGQFTLSFAYDETTKGKVVIHQNEMNIPFNYQGKYFKNIPIRIRAIPQDGYYFSHWLETGNPNAEIDYRSDADATLTPIFTDQAVATDEVAAAIDLKVYPNPTQQYLSIELSERATPVMAILYDVFGKKIVQKTLTEQRNSIDFEGLTSGIYLLNINTDKGQITQRILIN